MEVTAVARDGHGYLATVDTGGERVEVGATQLLVATGRRPVTDRLDLDTVGVKTGDRGAIVVDEHPQSTNPRIWAAGDVTGHPQFVYLAAAHGTLAVENAFGQAGRTVDGTNLPRVTFTAPAIAAVGLTGPGPPGRGWTASTACCRLPGCRGRS